jgi:GAF domain-containing protein
VYDSSMFIRILSEFSGKLLTEYDVDTVLMDLMERLTELLGLDGSGVALAQGDRLDVVTAVPDPLAELEKVQIMHQSGPCVDAYRTVSVVVVADLEAQHQTWPEYCAVAERLGLGSVAGIPMRLGGTAIGALNLYDRGPRSWAREDIAAAMVMADIATSYLVNASKLRQQEQLNEQLQHALDSRSVIEQAKGIVAGEREITVELAFRRIRAHARSHSVTVRSVAESIVHRGLKL